LALKSNSKGLFKAGAAVGLVALVLGCWLCCSGTPDPSVAPKVDPAHVKVVLLVIDALRADGLGCYGYKRPVSPNLDALAAESIVFERFHAASPWTAPSFGSMLTGLSPTVHGLGELTRHTSKETYQASRVRITKLRNGVATLAEMLPQVTSGAVVNNAFLHPDVGLAAGFTHYDLVNPYGAEHPYRRAKGVTEATVDWLKKYQDQSVFLMVHYFDPHIPYHPPRKHRNMFAKERVGRIGVRFARPKAIRKGEFVPTAAEKQHIRDLYDAEVHYMDKHVGELIDEMDDMGILDETWLVVTADHGEEHFDHGGFEHGHRYEEEVTRVPLIIRPPGGKWRSKQRVWTSARHVDLVPTILDWFAVKSPPNIEGRSLMPVILEKDKAHRPAYMEYNLYLGRQAALFDGRYKLIQNLDWKQNRPSPLYDLKSDPRETEPLGAEHPIYPKMQEKLAAYRTELKKAALAKPEKNKPVELSPEVEKSLRALGYVE
jgi:arylsulfatase A-like enzyme